MRRLCVPYLLVTICLGLALAAHAQDDESPSLGDVARQSRQAKQQKDGQQGNAQASQAVNNGNPATVSTLPGQGPAATAANSTPTGTPKKTVRPANNVAVKTMPSARSPKKVFTDEDMGAADVAADTPSASKGDMAEAVSGEPSGGKNPPEYWSSRILSLKNAIASLKSDIDRLSASIQYAPGNCVEGCVEWNQHQQEKQQQVDGLKAQLEEMQKQLEDMQESARKQGYGSSVYDP